MRFFTTLATLAAISVASASTAASPATLSLQLGSSLTASNHYGAPLPPWEPGCHPGWYYGDHPDALEKLLFWLKDTVGLVHSIVR